MLNMRPALLLLAAASLVSAEPTLTFERRVDAEPVVIPRTNAERLSRGLAPLVPRRLQPTRTEFAPRSGTSPTPGQCNTGSPACCQSMTTAGALDASTKLLLGLLGINLSNLNLPIGLLCSPLSVIGVGGNSCNQNPVCCSNIVSSALIGINCLPINISL